MDEQFERTALLVGEAGVKRLRESGVVVFGLGGVGGQLVEALARAGIGRFLLVDFDRISKSNINRQILALHSNVGRLKTEVAQQRILDINPAAEVKTEQLFVDNQSIAALDFSPYDYVADAVDTVEAKLAIIQKARAEGKGIISSMGAGGRLDSGFLVAEIGKTHGCPLAKKMRSMLKKQGITDIKAVFSPIAAENYLADSNLEDNSEENSNSNSNSDLSNSDITSDSNETGVTEVSKARRNYSARRAIGSVSFVPPSAGLVMAGEIIRTLLAD